MAERRVAHHHHRPASAYAYYDPLVDMFERPLNMLQALDIPFYGRATGRSGLGEMMRDFGLDRQQCEVTDDENKFAVKLDVSQYKPEELEVTTRNNEMVISGKHEERQDDDHGYVSRQFVRRYVLPEGASAEGLTSGLSKEGFLTVEAPKQPALGGARKIPIQQQGK